MIAHQDTEKYYKLLTALQSNRIVHTQQTLQLYATLLDTLLGPMIAIADDTHVYFVNFLDAPAVERALAQLQNKTAGIIENGSTKPLRTLADELKRYCEGTLTLFKTPVQLVGTDFQHAVWSVLDTILFGQTRSYAEIATLLDKPTAYRAVAQANAANPVCLVIPCHRVINSDGSLGGYSAGIERKKWLLTHERPRNNSSL